MAGRKKNPFSSNELDVFQQRLRRIAAKDSQAIASKPLSAKVTIWNSSQQRNQEENVADSRGRSHSTLQKKQTLLASEKPVRSLSKSCHRERSMRASKRWSSSAAYRLSVGISVRSQSGLRNTKSANDLPGMRFPIGYHCGEDTLARRSRSISRSAPAASHQGTDLSCNYYPPQCTKCYPSEINTAATGSIGIKNEMLGRAVERTRSSNASLPSRRFLVDVDEHLNIVKLMELKVEPILTKPGDVPRATRTSTSQSACNSEAEDAVKRVRSYSRRLPQMVKDRVEFDPPLKQSSSRKASTIDDEEDDSLGLSDIMGSSSTEAGAVSPNVSEINRTMQQNNSSHQSVPPLNPQNTSPKRGFFRKKTYRRITNSELVGKKEPSKLITGAALCLEAQQQNKKRVI